MFIKAAFKIKEFPNIMCSLSELVMTGTPYAHRTREEAAMPSNGLPKALHRCLYACSTKRKAPITSGGPSPVLRASKDKQCNCQFVAKRSK